MFRGYITDNFKIEKTKKIWKTTELTITRTNHTYGIVVNKSEIDELIMLLEKSKNLFKESGVDNNEYSK